MCLSGHFLGVINRFFLPNSDKPLSLLVYLLSRLPVGLYYLYDYNKTPNEKYICKSYTGICQVWPGYPVSGWKSNSISGLAGYPWKIRTHGLISCSVSDLAQSSVGKLNGWISDLVPDRISGIWLCPRPDIRLIYV